MRTAVMNRFGALLDILNTISDVKCQLVLQGSQPRDFVPSQLIRQWIGTFLSGKDFSRSDLDEEIVAVLYDFDTYLDHVLHVLPHDTYNKEAYIRHDSIWQEIREMANWTLMRIAFLHMPGEIAFTAN